MRIQHNISALNAANRLKQNDNSISKNIQKLSSGYRINSAADDAAGLAVSEKMRSQINGLNQAEDNASNGEALVQTAEGGLNETESILQRMNTLAVESANGTYQDGTDRVNLNKEVTALKSEIDRISTSTNFNQINLLDGTLGSTGEAAAAKVQLSDAALSKGAYGLQDATSGIFSTAAYANETGYSTGDTLSYTIKYTDADGKDRTATASFTYVSGASNSYLKAASGATYAVSTGGNDIAGNLFSDAAENAIAGELAKDANFTASFGISAAAGGIIQFTAAEKGTGGAKATGIVKTETLKGVTSTTDPTLSTTQAQNKYETTDVTKLAVGSSVASADIVTVNGKGFALVQDDVAQRQLQAQGVTAVMVSTGDISASGTNYYVTTAGLSKVTIASELAAAVDTATGLKSVSDSSGKVDYVTSNEITGESGISFQIGSENKADQRVSLSIADMSSKGLGITSISIEKQQDAESAIDTIKAAINTVSATRADLGALQNRLEHTTNNLSTMSENLTSAESNIRDVDMSDEYVQYSKNQILSQAATAMLTQANAQPQNVLSLLKG